MIKFSDEDIKKIQDQCVEAFDQKIGHSLSITDIPLEKYPDFKLHIERYVNPSPEYPDNRWVLARVDLVSGKDAGAVVGWADFEGQTPTNEILKQVVSQSLNSFASFYNAIESDQRPQYWQSDLMNSLNARVAFANGRIALNSYIKEKNQPVRMQPAKTTEKVDKQQEEKKQTVASIEFNQEDIDKIAERILSEVKPGMFEGYGRDWQKIKLPMDFDPMFSLEVNIDRVRGGKNPHFAISPIIKFDGNTILRETQDSKHLTFTQDLNDIVKKAMNEFSNMYNAIKKGEHVTLPHLYGDNISKAEFKRDFTLYIRYGDRPPEPPKRDYELGL